MNNNEFGAKLAKETLTGDIAAFLIDRLRQFPKPYQQMSEKEQGEQIEMAKTAARELVSKAVGIVASGGRKTTRLSTPSLKKSRILSAMTTTRLKKRQGK